MWSVYLVPHSALERILQSVDVLSEHLSALIPHHGCQVEARVQTNGYSSVQKIMEHNI